MGCLLKGGGGLHARLRIGAVLLAAGEGSRMGGVVKSLIRLQGVPLISRHLIALSGAGVDQVVVVTGHARDAVEAQRARGRSSDMPQWEEMKARARQVASLAREQALQR